MPRVQLRINRMSDVYTEVANFMSPTQIVIEESVISNIKHPLIISDCRQGEVHTVSKIDKLSNGYQITLKNHCSFDTKKLLTWENGLKKHGLLNKMKRVKRHYITNCFKQKN